MPPQELLLVVFCTVDDELKAAGGPPRRPGPRPRLADSEVITIEIVGELWGIADDKAILRHFRAYHLREFPALARVDRTRFARHAADLCWTKRAIQRRLAARLGGPGAHWLVDSCPLPACRFGRAGSCRRFAGQAAYGFDPLARKAFYGSASTCGPARRGSSSATSWRRPTRTSWSWRTSWPPRRRA